MKSTFTALNLEPEDDDDNEIDDSKEIQAKLLTYPLILHILTKPDRRSPQTLPERAQIPQSGTKVLQ